MIDRYISLIPIKTPPSNIFLCILWSVRGLLAPGNATLVGEGRFVPALTEPLQSVSSSQIKDDACLRCVLQPPYLWHIVGANYFELLRETYLGRTGRRERPTNPLKAQWYFPIALGCFIWPVGCVLSLIGDHRLRYSCCVSMGMLSVYIGTVLLWALVLGGRGVRSLWPRIDTAAWEYRSHNQV